ncbi:MAG: GyrI-like domain-containing protein [Zoogloea oleivorans]|jgi:hypothetical protein|uniref:GyrI-like domain-containing protein n=1 Tax=Zoogloea oleivorans TaxID=1552750 RepID=UPI002A3593B9|nr:GyrI-like domain-containing protein [Zoogloea oleivorans]MDY0036607.1 GyrI-like domain-containing protein [Zoogloea oleivorans]
MKRVDYKKELSRLYKPSAKRVEIVEVPRLNYLVIDGEGDPNRSQSFQDAVDALFPLSYALKFMVQRGETGMDYGVMPLEGLWWADDMSPFSVENKDGWKWTLMMMQPELVTVEMFWSVLAQVKAKKNPPSLPLVRFEGFEEGKVAQTLHIGPFSEEGPTVEKVHAFIEESGSRRKGKHHEIYLSDIRRAAPERWKTVIRQPIA